MLKLRNAKRALALTASALALATGATIATGGTAMANGGNWAVQFGPAGQGCYAYTLWTSNHVTGYIYQQPQSSDDCFIQIRQWWRSSGVQTGSDTEYTWGSATTAYAPHNSPYNYYYYGPSGSDYLCVQVYAQDNTAPPPWYAYTTYGSGC